MKREETPLTADAGLRDTDGPRGKDGPRMGGWERSWGLSVGLMGSGRDTFSIFKGSREAL